MAGSGNVNVEAKNQRKSGMSGTILYDYASKGSKCWSSSVLKARVALNFKSVPYTTRFLQMDNISQTLQPLGCPPSADPEEPYLLPTLFIEGSFHVGVDSIIKFLESTFPATSLRLSHPVTTSIKALATKALIPLLPEIIPQIGENVVDTPSQAWFHRNEEEDWGKPLEQLRREDGGEKCYAAVRGVWADVAALLKQEEGSFFLGKELSYADIIWASQVEFFRRATQTSYQRLVDFDNVFHVHYKAVEAICMGQLD